MQPLYPLKFLPRFKERIWGGRMLETLYHKKLPPAVLIGESWEISDRPGEVSVVANGPLAGSDLHSLVQSRHSELLARAKSTNQHFPLLIKILDAREKLSLQVHPPAQQASMLGGEPKTELWYITHAGPGAELYVGLKRGVSRREFEEQLRAGTVERCFHRIQVRAGDAMFLPSGRVHAIGAGLTIFEIQQNSDTTYRVFDWNRLDRNGRPRPLHVAESLASIDFNDFEPALAVPQSVSTTPRCHRLASDPVFVVDVLQLAAAESVSLEAGRMQILGVVEGSLAVTGTPEQVCLSGGEFCLIPASLHGATLEPAAATTLLRVQLGEN